MRNESTPIQRSKPGGIGVDLRRTSLPSATEVDTLETAARLRLSIARLARRLRQEAGTGLSPSQQSALVSIDLHGPLTLGQLARLEQVSPPTVTRIAAKLEDDGLVSRRVDANDRRVSHVEVTDEGQRRLEHGRSRRNAWLAVRLQGFDAGQRRRLEDALDVLEALADPSDSTTR
jgi:DNA-binding MarR family transcriptional regulator